MKEIIIALQDKDDKKAYELSSNMLNQQNQMNSILILMTLSIY